MATPRVFISFEFEQDKGLRDLLIGQSRNDATPFEVIDHSLHEQQPEKEWAQKAASMIARADIVIVIVGPTTYKAKGVLTEIAIARRLHKRVVQLIGYKDRTYRRVANAGYLYRWTWKNLEKILDIRELSAKKLAVDLQRSI